MVRVVSRDGPGVDESIQSRRLDVAIGEFDVVRAPWR